MSKENFKSIMKSAVNNVMNGRPPSAPAQINEREKAKIVSLVQKYLAKRGGN